MMGLVECHLINSIHGVVCQSIVLMYLHTAQSGSGKVQTDSDVTLQPCN